MTLTKRAQTPDENHRRRRLSIPLVVVSAGAAVAIAALALPGWGPAAANPSAAGSTVDQAAGVNDASGDDPYRVGATAPSSPAVGGDAAATSSIGITDFAFTDSPTVAPRTVVTVVNNDGVAHTLTAVDGAFDSGVIGGGSQTALTAPGAPGSYQFFCSIHPSMTGSIAVA